MTFLFFAGLASITAGVALIYPPAALIVGGILLTALAVLRERAR